MPLPGQEGLGVSLPSSYSLPNGVNGNEHNFDNQTFEAFTTHEQLKAKLLEIKLRILVNVNTDSGYREHFACPRIGFKLFLP